MTTSRLQQFVQSFGPAWIVMIADVDAPSVLTAAEAGATYGYGLIWFFLVLVIPLFLIQEASGRIGIATGKGLGDVIRENYSRRIAVLASVPMAMVDVVSYVAEYTGIAIGMSLVGIPPVVSMPVAFAAHMAIVFRRKYVTMEKALFGVGLVLILSYAGSLFARGVSTSSITYISASPHFLFFLAAGAGAVVMPFMLFYQASATAQKGTVRLWAMRLETLLGAVASEVGMVVIIMANSGLGPSIDFTNPGTLSRALESVAGGYATYLFAVGLIAAAFLALVVISLASSWAVVEALGLKKTNIFWLYALESIPAAIVPIFLSNQLSLVLDLMVALVFVLIGPGVLMGLLASNRSLMGRYASNGRWSAAYWLSLAAVLSFGIVALAAAV